jgi:hypothetical protein
MNEYKKIALCTFLIISSICSFAQEISVRGGFNLSQMLIKWDGEVTSKNVKLMPGFQVGPVINFPINNSLSFETGLLYSTKGIKEIGHRTVDQKTLFRLNLAYMEVPLIVKISFPFQHVRLFANGGSYFAQGLFGNILTKEDFNDSKGVWKKVEWGDQENSFQKFDFGLNFGLGMKYKVLQFGICYENGITNISGYDRSKSKVHNRAATLYLSYVLWDKLKTKH